MPFQEDANLDSDLPTIRIISSREPLSVDNSTLNEYDLRHEVAIEESNEEIIDEEMSSVEELLDDSSLLLKICTLLYFNKESLSST